uniref:Uncharacterized protein n=1 Tax=Anguilla anguilla TaxID=7936 RepID=A0A0E9SAZ8_ANGAN
MCSLYVICTGRHVLAIAYCQMLGKTKCDNVYRFWNELGSRFLSL